MSEAARPLRLFERVRLVTVRPPDYAHSAAFDELVSGFAAAFAALGTQVDTATNQFLGGEGMNIVFGAHLLSPTVRLPPNSVIVNLEQMHDGHFAQAYYIDLLQRHPVIDYSPRNVARIRELTGSEYVHSFRIGYTPVLSRIQSAPQQDIDVLFYGVVNERRRKIFDALVAAGLVAVTLSPGIYGAERDAFIARSKVVLNVHYYEDRIHELVRTSYLLANSKAVVSECEGDTEIDADIRAGILALPYAQLVEGCVALVRDEVRRAALERQGFEHFSKRDQAALLAEVLPKLARPLPKRINLGSGKAYDPERLNIDVDAKWNPDVVGNLCATDGLRQTFFSARFGLVRLEPSSFDEISAIDVLEHIPDLATMMTRCLELLRDGGTMHIVVPYDLSWGAWQDPTHVRAFNERSWLYYTEWHWYLGWTEARFELREMRMKLSPVGDALRQRGMVGDELFRTPRAVDEMHVALVKRPCTDAERQKARIHHGSARERARGAANTSHHPTPAPGP